MATIDGTLLAITIILPSSCPLRLHVILRPVLLREHGMQHTPLKALSHKVGAGSLSTRHSCGVRIVTAVARVMEDGLGPVCLPECRQSADTPDCARPTSLFACWLILQGLRNSLVVLRGQVQVLQAWQAPAGRSVPAEEVARLSCVVG